MYWWVNGDFAVNLGLCSGFLSAENSSGQYVLEAYSAGISSPSFAAVYADAGAAAAALTAILAFIAAGVPGTVEA
jgi:ketol-acid reductoisomerase